MCGIYGYNWDNKELSIEIAQALKHRGPDNQSAVWDKDMTIGHNRLSIIDLSEKGNQPMESLCGNYLITFNGEIFNYKELREDLDEEGISFRTDSDTEVLLEGYIKYGTRILELINGQFSFCIYDKSKKELFLARDESGILPLYFHDYKEKFIFGSEMKVMMLAGVPKEIDEFSLLFYLNYGYTPDCRTIFQNVQKLRPGHYIKYCLDKKQIKEYTQYWEYKLSSKKEQSFKDAKSELLARLDTAVKRRLVADVPVGAFLSGGIDSSAIVAIMSTHTDNLKTFSITFDHKDFDESKYARKVSKQFGTEHHEIEFAAKDVEALMLDLPNHYDEPFGDHSLIPMFLVSQVASKHVKVCLSGDGADELFGGYNKYTNYKKVNNLKYLTGLSASNYIPKKLKRALIIASMQDYKQYANLNSYKYIEYTDEFDDVISAKFKPFFKEEHWLNPLLKADFEIYLPEDILTKVDRAAMAHSLEVRPPFLDKQLIKFASELDPDLKIKNGDKKYILKQAMKGILPNEIINRPKKGFGSPIKHYFRKELSQLVWDWAVDYDKHDHFKELDLELKYLEHKEGKEDFSRILFSCMMFNLWWDRWMT